MSSWISVACKSGRFVFEEIAEASQSRWVRIGSAVVLALALSILLPTSRSKAACTVPNTISNGQVADATAVMGNFNALKDCTDSAVKPSGTPAAGNLATFSSSGTITNGNLSGDCTTSGTLAVTCAKTNGSSFGALATSTDASQLTGTISVNRFNNGLNADSSRYLRGDGTWATPSGGGGTGARTEVQWTIPALANFAWTNQGATATAADTPFGISIRDDTAAGSGNIRILDQAAPTTPWTVYTRLSPFLNPTSGGGQSGIVIRNASTGKLLIVGAWNASPGSFLIQRWTNATSFSATSLNVTLRQGGPYWVAVMNDGSSVSVKLSADGYTWGPAVYSETLGSFLGTADRIGFGIQLYNVATGMVLNSFSTTAPTP